MSQNGLYAKLEKWFNEQPDRLVTFHDIMEEFGIEDGAAKNSVYNLWRTGKVLKAPEGRDVGGKRPINQFAVNVKGGETWVRNENYAGGKNYTGTKTSKTGKTLKRTKGSQIPSAKEVRALFMATMNNLAALEDMMVRVVEVSDEIDKRMAKIRNMADF